MTHLPDSKASSHREFIPRLLQKTLEATLAETPKSILVLGPRQTGKSTLLRLLKPDLEINLSHDAVYRAHLKDPELLDALLAPLSYPATVLIDEIQRIPSLLGTIQSWIDREKKPARFLLTGSSARKLRRGQVNLLPGRLFRYSLFPLTYWELKEKWDLQRVLTRGTLPEVYLASYGEELLSNYVEIYLKEEIQAEALARNIHSFSRFLDLAAECSGQIINYSQLASDSEIPKETIRRYFDILEDTLLVHRMGGFTEIQGSRKAMQREKFLFFDLGVRHAILQQQGNRFSEKQLGQFFEQEIILNVIALQNLSYKKWKLFYYRDDLQREVDLIIDREKDILAVEIKYSTQVQKKDLAGLSHFASVVPRPVRRILVYRGDLVQIREGVDVLPYSVFLDRLRLGEI